MKTNEIVEEALSASHCIVSVMGAHAGEEAIQIFTRKIKDIERINRTFWLIKSPKAKPAIVQEMCSLNSAFAVFVEPATRNGARPATSEQQAISFSENGLTWNPLPKGLGPVTGKLNSKAYALVFDRMETMHDSDEIDLWNYADFILPENPIRLILGCSTVCATKKAMEEHPERLKSRFRRIVAVARLASPFCVWVR